MITDSRGKRVAIVALGLVMLLSPFTTPVASTSAAPPALVDTALDRVWNHCDKPVQAGVATRSWMWGPSTFYTTYEPYAEGHASQHLVSYFDKSRMEINDPDGDRNSEWYVTNGLLVVDMITGKIQIGNNMFLTALPANVAVAGDTATSVNAPTYAALANVASLNNNNRAPNRAGQDVRERLDSHGNVSPADMFAGWVHNVLYEPTLGHNIPDVFWSFMNQKGTTYHDGQYMPNDTVVDWLFAMGYPITEPYWIQIRVGSQDHWVVMQAFQRRILTYSPDNPAGWKVEMGNVGRAYYDWRYATQPPPPPAPTATPVPAPAAAITLDPQEGSIDTEIAVTGAHFLAYAGVGIAVERSAARYYRTLANVTAGSDGSFRVTVQLPAEVSQYADVLITATANGGAVRVSKPFYLRYRPAVTISPSEVAPNGAVRVQGTGFPAGVSVRLGLVLPHNNVTWVGEADTNRSGAFDAYVNVGSLAVGIQFNVVAVGPNGVKASSSGKVTVIAQPSLQVIPGSGPTGVYVTLKGTAWPPNRAIGLGLRGATSQTIAWRPDSVYTDYQGTFSVAIWIGPEYAGYSEVRLIAADSISTIRGEIPYYVTTPPVPTPTPIPPGPSVAVSPNVAAVGQLLTITGNGWPANATVSLGLGRAVVEQWIGTATADAQGRFTYGFTLGNHWLAAGQISLTAAIAYGPIATTPLWVLGGSRIVPGGLPLTVNLYRGPDGVVSIRLAGTGWTPRSPVDLNVISADGTLNVPVGSTKIKDDGTLQANFTPVAPWWGRADLGVRAVGGGTGESSIRYLPWTDLLSAAGSNTYTVRGVNWPAGTQVTIYSCVSGADEVNIGTVTTDSNGFFTINVTLPRRPVSGRDGLAVRAENQPYTAWFAY